jgi:hypothetical protein
MFWSRAYPTPASARTSDTNVASHAGGRNFVWRRGRRSPQSLDLGANRSEWTGRAGTGIALSREESRHEHEDRPYQETEGASKPSQRYPRRSQSSCGDDRTYCTPRLRAVRAAGRRPWTRLGRLALGRTRTRGLRLIGMRRAAFVDNEIASFPHLRSANLLLIGSDAATREFLAPLIASAVSPVV